MYIEIHRDEKQEDRYHVKTRHVKDYGCYDTVEHKYRSRDEVIEIVTDALDQEDF